MPACRIVRVSRFKIVRVQDCQGVGLSGRRVVRV